MVFLERRSHGWTPQILLELPNPEAMVVILYTMHYHQRELVEREPVWRMIYAIDELCGEFELFPAMAPWLALDCRRAWQKHPRYLELALMEAY
ncbi:hypothetical protein CPSG_04914 [Coccidioides posadasii str. Silveira]|uniref:Uncharacterized protein n=1 Tax=Coccidioides posadasii (strain RMSCC 757 / Silveira) TaxID=443226 RepID=E9D5N4_COCPS|nr:hypothetical protein CPSG_04914 [Coccidioides posadasii str. Silveira]